MPAISVRLATAVFCMCVASAGCQAADTPPPQPTYTCTPEAGGEPFACTQYQYDEMVAKDALYAEAEAVYRRFLAEDVRIMRAGGVTEPTPVLLETTTGAFLEDVMAQYRSMNSEKARFEGGEFALMSISRRPGVTKGGSKVALQTCVDARSSKLYVGSVFLRRGAVAQDLFYFGSSDGRLRIIGADGTEVESCG